MYITKVFSKIIFVWLGYILLTGIFIGFGILFQNKKRNYLLNNYKEFNCYEVIVDNFAPSSLYKQYVYYKVKIDDNGTIKTINTNPYFSNSPITKFSPAEYNGKKVVGLYDRKYNNYKKIKSIRKWCMQKNSRVCIFLIGVCKFSMFRVCIVSILAIISIIVE